jgi:hypothetical protein
MEYKRRINLDEPNKTMKVIIQSSAFLSIDVEDLESMARNVGIYIFAITSSCKISQNINSVCGVGRGE